MVGVGVSVGSMGVMVGCVVAVGRMDVMVGFDLAEEDADTLAGRGFAAASMDDVRSGSSLPNCVQIRFALEQPRGKVTSSADLSKASVVTIRHRMVASEDAVASRSLQPGLRSEPVLIAGFVSSLLCCVTTTTHVLRLAGCPVLAASLRQRTMAPARGAASGVLFLAESVCGDLCTADRWWAKREVARQSRAGELFGVCCWLPGRFRRPGHRLRPDQCRQAVVGQRQPEYITTARIWQKRKRL